MIIDFEHHWTPYELWKRRGGREGQHILRHTPDGRVIGPIDDTSRDIQIHLEIMDKAGIDMAVLTGGTGGVADMEEARLFNDECSKLVKQYPDRFAGFASIKPLAGKTAMDELERAVKDLGLKGVTLLAQEDGRFVDSPELWPFYEKVSQLKVPLFVHISVAAEGFDACQAPYDLNRTIVREFDLAAATARICLGGVLERFPDLKFIVAHFGGGISSIKERLDRYIKYMGAGFWSGQPLISEPYLDRFNQHFSKLYFNMAGREIGMETVKCALTNISPRRLLFGTDYPPNFINDPVGMKTYIEKIRQLDLDEASIEAMLGDNGAELLGL